MPDRLHLRRRGDQLAIMALVFSIAAIAMWVIVGATVFDTAGKTEKAVCAIVSYAERQADNIRAAQGASSATAGQLETLAGDMRGTGIRCSPRPEPAVESPSP